MHIFSEIFSKVTRPLSADSFITNGICDAPHGTMIVIVRYYLIFMARCMVRIVSSASAAGVDVLV